MFIRNVGELVPDYVPLHPRNSTLSLLILLPLLLLLPLDVTAPSHVF
jgi:hypothetical protein